jgi:hypothetical protein
MHALPRWVVRDPARDCQVVASARAATELDAGLLGVIALTGGPPLRHWYACGPARAVLDESTAFVVSAGTDAGHESDAPP